MIKVENGIVKKYGAASSEVIIPDGIKEIGRCAFQKNKYVQRVVLPDSITRIGYSAFFSCRDLKEIVFPDTISYIDDLAFGFTALTVVNLPQGLTKVSPFLFSHCKELRKVSVPDGVTHIGVNAFAGCLQLSELIVPDSLQTIDKKAFYNCTALKTIHIRKNGQHITLPVNGVLDMDSWRELQRLAAKQSEPAVSAPKPQPEPAPQPEPEPSHQLAAQISKYEEKIALLTKRCEDYEVSNKQLQAQITELQEQIEELEIQNQTLSDLLVKMSSRQAKPPCHVMSFHPLTDAELVRLS